MRVECFWIQVKIFKTRKVTVDWRGTVIFDSAKKSIQNYLIDYCLLDSIDSMFHSIGASKAEKGAGHRSLKASFAMINLSYCIIRLKLYCDTCDT